MCGESSSSVRKNILLSSFRRSKLPRPQSRPIDDDFSSSAALERRPESAQAGPDARREALSERSSLLLGGKGHEKVTPAGWPRP